MSDGLNLRKTQSWPGIKEQAIRLLLFCCAALSIVTTVAIIAVLVSGTLDFFSVDEPTSAVDSISVAKDTATISLTGTGEPTNVMDVKLTLPPAEDEPDAEEKTRSLEALIGADGKWELELFRDGKSFEVIDKVAEKEDSGLAEEQYVTLDFDDVPLCEWSVEADDPNFVRVSEYFTGTEWYPTSGRFGVLPLVWNTVLVALVAGIFGLPIGLLIAVYLSEYASPRARGMIKPALEILAGIPTIVYGFFALTFITPYILQPLFRDVLGFRVGQYNALSAGIVVGIMIIPMVSSLSEDVLRAVPRGLREAAYALGATRLDVSMRVVVPAALSGIIAAFLLAISRAIGETMAVTLAAGNQPNMSFNVFEAVQTMTAFIVSITSGEAEVGSAPERSLYAVGLTLFVMTLAMNIFSQYVLRRFREAYE